MVTWLAETCSYLAYKNNLSIIVSIYWRHYCIYIYIYLYIYIYEINTRITDQSFRMQLFVVPKSSFHKTVNLAVAATRT